MINFDLGQTVSYIRHNQDENKKVQILEGEAVLSGIGLDGEGRPIVLLKDADKSFNAFLACINRDKEFCNKFRVEIPKIMEIADEGNKAIKELAAEYNAKTCAIYDDLVGKAVE